MWLLAAEGLVKQYRSNGSELTVLRGASLMVRSGEFVVLYGASGSGKSTLLHVLGGLDRPDAGEVAFQGQALYRQSEAALAAYRNTAVGFVFQFYHLLPELSVEENVMLPALLAGLRRSAARTRARDLLAAVGLSERLTATPGTLSGGEQQRVAIARALIQTPPLLFADEPTGNLDPERGAQVMALLRGLQRGRDTTVIMVTHNRELMLPTDRRLELREGMIHEAA
ncbi:MAG: ABC transporter ATP-binding protein [Deltaproteobacteria bacterium]|nr:ABC transporter ATP-binding protein [Deltaproteobacteria bacterium]